MATRTEKERKKLEQDMLQKTLNELLRDEDNRYCADCDAKGPRWASWNLGVFLCIRCAGIHRNLGVHVSKVKSVNLDTWTPEQVAHVQVMGNSVARGVYEAHLPENFRRPQTDSSLEAFIRAKYDHKRYIMKDWVPPRVDPRNWPRLEEGASQLSYGRSGGGGDRKKQSSTGKSGRTKSSSSNEEGMKGIAPPPGSTGPSGGEKKTVSSEKVDSSANKSQLPSNDKQDGALADLVDLSIGPISSTQPFPPNGALTAQTAVTPSLDDILGGPNSAQLPVGPQEPVIPSQDSTGIAPAVTSARSNGANPLSNTLQVGGPSGGLGETIQRSSEADLNNLMGSHPTEGSNERKTKADILALYGSTHSLPGSLPASNNATTAAPFAPTSHSPMFTSGHGGPTASLFQGGPVQSGKTPFQPTTFPGGGFDAPSYPSQGPLQSFALPTTVCGSGMTAPPPSSQFYSPPQQVLPQSTYAPAMFANSNPFGCPNAQMTGPGQGASATTMSAFPPGYNDSNGPPSTAANMWGGPDPSAAIKQQNLSKIQSQLASIQISNSCTAPQKNSVIQPGSTINQQNTLSSNLWH